MTRPDAHHTSLRSLGRLLLAAAAAAALLGAGAGAASAQVCTLGFDSNLDIDRAPSLCAYFNVPSGQAGFPITAGPDGRLWFFTTNGGTLSAAKMTTSGQVDRFPLPPGSTPNAITAGPDGALWYAGDGRIGRLDPNGGGTEYPVPALRATGIVAGPDGALWVSAGATAVRVTPQGAVSVIPLAGGGSSGGSTGGGVVQLPGLSNLLTTANAQVSRVIGGLAPGMDSHGITVGPDGGLWIASGSALTRVDPSGSVRRVPLPGNLPADGGIVTASDGTLWFSSAGPQFSGAGSAVGRYDPGSGSVQRLGITGRALDIVRGPGSANVWVSTATDSGRANWITRMSTRSFGSERPFGCRGQNPAACWFRIQNVPLGDVRYFNTHDRRPGGITVGPDGNVWYTEGDRVGRIIPFRGAAPCYQRVTRNSNFGCGRELSHTGAVTHSGYAYLRTNCPYLTFRLCSGSVALKVRGGRTVGRAPFVLAANDTPRVRVRMPGWMMRKLKRGGRVKVDATYTSQDMGGITRVVKGIWFLTERTGP